MFGERLKEERKRLRLTQPQLANISDSAKRTVIDWEKEKSSPTAKQLIRMSDNGMDTNYLLTGVRAMPVELPSDELFLLDSFRSLDSEQKKMALQFLIGGFDGLHDKNNGVVNSPNTKISNSFNSQSGFTELPFLLSCTACSLMAWLLGALANFKATTDVIASMSFGIPAVVLWTLTMVMAIFGYYASEKRNKDKQEQ